MLLLRKRIDVYETDFGEGNKKLTMTPTLPFQRVP
jgi:hypothetical protein